MTRIDSEQERERLAARYAAMSDLELAKVGEEPAKLTDWAFLALRAEMAKRGLQWAGANLPLPSQMQPSSSPDESENAPIVIRQYRDMPAAVTDRMVLEAGGIECFLYDENMVRLDWLWSNLLGGLKLVVRRKDAQDAETLLQSKAEGKFEVEGVGEYQQELCPKCGSDDISCDELMKRIAGASLLVGVPIALVQRGWNCHACGHTWEVAEEAKSDSSDT
jgi:hypothetical protein